MKRLALAGIVGGVVISGCGNSTTPPDGQRTPLTTISIDREAGLRNDIQSQRSALEDFRIDDGAALMCEQYRDAYRHQQEAQLPTMASIATPEQAADPAYMAALPGLLNERYPNTYSEERTNLADAAGRQDPVAFHEAARVLMGRIFNVTDQQVDNITIAGDTATADVTTTTTLNDQPANTITNHKTYVKHGPTWLDGTV